MGIEWIETERWVAKKWRKKQTNNKQCGVDGRVCCSLCRSGGQESSAATERGEAEEEEG